MKNRDIDAKIAVISDHDAAKLGIKKEEENLVTVDGQVVEVEWIDEFGEDWHLPNIVLKAQAYLKTLKNPQDKKFVNLYSNKYENFERIVDFDLIEGTTLDKVRQFLVANEYGPESAIDEFNYGLTTIKNKEDVNKVLEKISANLSVYKEELLDNKKKLLEIDKEYESFNISDDEYIDERSEVLATLKIMSLSIYRDLVLLNSLSKKPVDFDAVDSSNSIDELVEKLQDASRQAKASGITAEVVSKSAKLNRKLSKEEVKRIFDNWSVDMHDPWYLDLVEWTEKEFVHNENTDSQQEKTTSEEPKVEATSESQEESTTSSKQPVKVWSVDLTEKSVEENEQPVQTEQETESNQQEQQEVQVSEKLANFEEFEKQDAKEIEEWNNLDNEPQEVYVAPLPEYSVNMNDPVYYCYDEWTTSNSFGGTENKQENKQAKTKGIFKDWGFFKKKKQKEEQKVESTSNGYYLVTDINDNEVKISDKNPDFKGLVEWESNEFNPEEKEKFANFEIVNKNYMALMDKSGNLLDQKRRVVTKEEAAIDSQIESIKNEIDDLENQLNEIKQK